MFSWKLLKSFYFFNDTNIFYKYFALFLGIFFMLLSVKSKAEDIDSIINNNLMLVAKGKSQEVKSTLPDLLVGYPSYPGVKLLLAVLVEDANKAAEIYKDIVTNNPDNIWADDAYWRLIQYYAISGEVLKAKQELETFRNNYPTSPFLVPVSETVRFAESVIKSKNSSLKQAENNVSQSVTKEAQVLSPVGQINQLEVEPKQAIKVEDTPKLISKFEKNGESGKNEKQEDEQVNPFFYESQDTDAVQVTIKGNETNKAKDNKVISTDTANTEEESEIKPQTSLEDEIALRQSISKQLAQNKIEEDNKQVVNKQVVNNNEYKKNPLAEKPEANTLLKVEPFETGSRNEQNSGQTKIEELEPKMYGLQVALYTSEAAAELEMKKYLKQRMRTEVKQKIVNGDKMYAVVIGNYSSAQSAEGARVIVEQQCNCSPILIEK